MAPTRARTSPPPPPVAMGGVRRPAFHFPANDNRPPLRAVAAGIAVLAGIAGLTALVILIALN